MPKVSVFNGDQLSICTCPNKLMEFDVNTNPSKASTGDMCHSLPIRANYRTVPYKLGKGDYRRQVLNNNLSAFFFTVDEFQMLVSFQLWWLLMDLGVTPTGGIWVLDTRGAETQ